MNSRLLLLLSAFLLMSTFATAQTTVFSDDFESGLDNWVLEGTWATTNNQSNSPSFSLTDSPGGNSLDTQNISATMMVGVDLTNLFEATLNFSAIYAIEDPFFDYCFIEVSGDDGMWVNIDTFYGTNFLPWDNFTYSLNDFIGNSDVKVRFRLKTDSGFTKDGVYIDDVAIVTSTEDITQPIIIHEPPFLYESNIGDVTMIAEITDLSGIGTTTLKYSIESGVFESVEGMNVGQDSFAFVIPAIMAGTEVLYFVEATDASVNNNLATSPTFNYIAGNHIFYDNGQIDEVNSFGPASTTGYGGAAVRMSTFGKTDLVYALVRNHREVNIANANFQFHIWGDNNGTPGADMIAPITVTPEATVADNDVMTRIDLAPYAAELSDVNGDVFVGITVPAGQTYVTQTNTGDSRRNYILTNSGWILSEDVDYHIRLVTDSIVQPNACGDAADLTDLLGKGPMNIQTSRIYNNEDVAPTGEEPTVGWECFGEEDADGNSTPMINNPLWFTFVGDGEKYRITTTDCNGTAPDYVNNGDTQFALYEGTTCTELTPADCDEDADGVPPQGPFPAGLNYQTTAGTVYYLLVDGFIGAGGDFCIEFNQTTEPACNDLRLGTASASETVCLGQTTDIQLDGFTFAPPEGMLNGFVWSVHTEDITGSMDPWNLASWVSNFPLSSTTYIPELTQGVNLPDGVYYLTPIVFADAFGGSDNWPAIDLTQACIIVGPSVKIEFLSEDPGALTVGSSFETEITPPGNNGQASVQVSGGTGSYTYLWDNGATTDTISNIAAGSYFVTVSDESDCVDDVIIEVVVDQSVGVGDPVFTQAISVQPNPAQRLTNVVLDFEEMLDLQISLTNNLGQVVLRKELNSVTQEVVALNLEDQANGVYMIHITDGERKAVQKLIIAK